MKLKPVTLLALLSLLAFGQQTDTLVGRVQENDVPLFPVQVEGSYTDTAGRYIDEKWGYIDTTGTLVIAPRFAIANRFSEGLAFVASRTGSTWKRGYIDKTGAFVIPEPHACGDFRDGRALCNFGFGGPCGYIDKTGKFDSISRDLHGADFCEGMARVELNSSLGKIGYIDTTCKLVIAPQFDRARDFSNGLAFVEKESAGEWPVIESTAMFGYIDKTGRLAVRPQIDVDNSLRLGDFSEGLASAVDDGAYGYIDTTGKFVIKPQFEEARAFREGLAAVKPLGGSFYYGYINKNGKMVIKPRFTAASGFSEGLARVRVKTEGFLSTKDGYVDKAGKMVITPQFADAEDFRGGLARVTLGTGYGYVNRSGRPVWQPSEHHGPQP